MYVRVCARVFVARVRVRDAHELEMPFRFFRTNLVLDPKSCGEELGDKIKPLSCVLEGGSNKYLQYLLPEVSRAWRSIVGIMWLTWL